MLSQLTKTIKMALKSTEEERAILRARSAVQRFPVVEWRQRMEDFHKRSITTSRHVSGPNAWRPSDGGGVGMHPMADTDDWNPVAQAQPDQPGWDSRSVNSYMNSPAQRSQESLVYGEHAIPPRLGGDDDYFSQRGSGQSSNQGYTDFLERANKAIARDQKGAPDPFLDGTLTPSRPFGAHSRVSSVESISSIVDEKSNSPLNKAIASVRHLNPKIRLVLTVLLYSSRIPMVVLLLSSFRSCRRSMLRILNMNYPLRSTS